MNIVRYLKAPNGVVMQKRKNGRFSYKSRLLLKTVCYEVSLRENVQRQRCKAFTGYLTVNKWLVSDVDFNANFVHKVNHPKMTPPAARFLCDSLASYNP